MENPFVYGDVVKGTCFTDREEEIKELKLDLSSRSECSSFLSEALRQNFPHDESIG